MSLVSRIDRIRPKTRKTGKNRKRTGIILDDRRREPRDTGVQYR
jgi:hypothetical protein